MTGADDYYPFGMQMEGRSERVGDPQDRYKFTGKERDKETGYDYFGARYYDARIARWLSVDPWAEKYPSLNPYNYTANNPLHFVDPDGRGIKWSEFVFLINNFRSAIAIGHPDFGSLPVLRHSISNAAYRLSEQTGLDPTQRNAVRHVTLLSSMTSRLGREVANGAAMAHEGNPTLSILKELLYNPLERTYVGADADMVSDLLNNAIGKNIGEKNSGADAKQLIIKVLQEYRDSGLWQIVRQKDGMYKIRKVKLTKEQYEQAVRNLYKRDQEDDIEDSPDQAY